MITSAAEEVYVFRHVLVREAAYQLLLPSSRARLHAWALEATEAALEGGDFAPWAAEMAEHARLAGFERRTELGAKRRLELARAEASYVQLAARHAEATFQNAAALRLWDRASEHPELPLRDRLEATVRAGSICQTLGWMDESLARLQRALPAAKELGDPGLLAGLYDKLATCCRFRQRYRESVRHYCRAYRLYGRENDARRAALVLAQLAVVLDLAGRPKTALRAHEAAVRMARRAGADREEGIALSLYALYFYRRGRLDEAEPIFLEALGLCRKTGEHQAAVNTLGNLAALYHWRGECDRAEPLYQEAIEACRRQGRLRDELHVSSNHVLLLSDQGRHADSEEAARRLLELAEENGNLSLQAKALERMAAAQEELERPVEALHNLGDALTRLHGQPTAAISATIHKSCCGILFSQGLLAASRSAGERAAAELASLGRSGAEGVATWELALLLVLLGEWPSALALTETFLQSFPHGHPQRRTAVQYRLHCLAAVLEEMPGDEPLRAEARSLLDELRDFPEDLRKGMDRLTAAVLDGGCCSESPIFRGSWVHELKPLCRLALLDRMRREEPDALERLQRQRPEILQALAEGTEGLEVPDWRNPDLLAV